MASGFIDVEFLNIDSMAKPDSNIVSVGSELIGAACGKNDPITILSIYARERARFFPEAGDIEGGVGGTRTGVKCLHAHYANHLAGGTDPVGTWVAERVEPVHPGDAEPGRVAAIDQGTNSTRLLVLEADGTELARDMIITRLGTGVDETRRLNPAALERTIAAIERFCRRARALHADRIRVAATSAVRDAANRGDLEEAVWRNAFAELEVLSGEQEAALSFLGATDGLDVSGPVFVLDIGGGSTEFIVDADAVSTQMGSVRLTERFVRTDPPVAAELEAMQTEIARVLEEADTVVPVAGAKTFVAVAGTATTVQAIALGLERYDPDRIHRTPLRLETAEQVLARLETMTTPERAALPVMAPGRADVIVAGALVLVAVMERWSFEEALVSETDILDGLAAELLARR
jgi:exopolyphosphatase/guanosine-5'-triphosphate,3'-diphosphate pyrophosphatase